MSGFVLINNHYHKSNITKPSDDGLKFKPGTRVKFISKANNHCDTQVYVDGKPLSIEGESEWITAETVKERVRIFHALGYHDHDQGYKVIVDQCNNYDVRYHVPRWLVGSFGIDMALQKKEQKGETAFRITDVSGKVFVVFGDNKPQEKIKLAISDQGTFDMTSIKIEDLDGVKVVGFYWLNPNHFEDQNKDSQNFSSFELPLNFRGCLLYGTRKFTPDQLPANGLKLEKTGYGGQLLISVTDRLNKETYLMGSIDRWGYLTLK